MAARLKTVLEMIDDFLQRSAVFSVARSALPGCELDWHARLRVVATAKQRAMQLDVADVLLALNSRAPGGLCYLLGEIRQYFFDLADRQSIV